MESNHLEWRHDQIKSLAYKLWEERGRPPGSPERDWLQAEREIRLREVFGEGPDQPITTHEQSEIYESAL
jgi:hypothetical protein